VSLEKVPEKSNVLGTYRQSGVASAAAAHESRSSERHIGASAAFFDVDNTMIRGASLFHFAAGLAKLKYFSGREIFGFGLKQMKFVLSGSEDLEDVASATQAALSFVQGRSVEELTGLSEIVFDERMVDKLIPGTLALAQLHIDAGVDVWLVTATPVELADLIARRLGLTGALGTVSQIENGVYTGELVGYPLHGLAKAEAVRALAASEQYDLSTCFAYSDSANDIPMLSTVGIPTAVNPDPELRAYAKKMGWEVSDFRKRAQLRANAVPAAMTAAGIAAGLTAGYTLGRLARGSKNT
jgi:HAD superfamily hydrolase (TIGR01490 family)